MVPVPGAAHGGLTSLAVAFSEQSSELVWLSTNFQTIRSELCYLDLDAVASPNDVLPISCEPIGELNGYLARMDANQDLTHLHFTQTGSGGGTITPTGPFPRASGCERPEKVDFRGEIFPRP